MNAMWREEIGDIGTLVIRGPTGYVMSRRISVYRVIHNVTSIPPHATCQHSDFRRGPRHDLLFLAPRLTGHTGARERYYVLKPYFSY